MIKASVILAAAFCVTCFLRRRSAAERHLVWIAAIISAALLPILSLLLPVWQPGLAQRVASGLPVVSARAAKLNLSHHAEVIFRADGIEATVTQFWPVVWFTGSIAG